MFLTSSQINQVSNMVDKLYLPSDICRYMKIDLIDFVKDLNDKSSELYDVFFNTLYKAEEEVKEKIFAEDETDNPEKLSFLVKLMEDYKQKLNIEINNA